MLISKNNDYLNLIEQLNTLSIEEVIEGYRLSLISFDGKSAIKFKKRYKALFYEYFLQLFMGLKQEDTYQLFLESHKQWKELIFQDDKKILAQIWLKTTKKHIDKDKILELLNQPYKLFKNDDEEKIYTQKSLFELVQMLLDSIELLKSHRESLDLAYEACISDNIEYVQSIRPKIRQDRRDLLTNIDLNIGYLLSKNNVEDALEHLDKIDSWGDDRAQRTKCKIAQNLFINGQFELALSIIDSLPIRFFHKFEAFKAAQTSNEKYIREIISNLEILIEECYLAEDQYDLSLLDIGFSIADKYPLLAFEVIEKLIEDNYGESDDLKQYIALNQLFNNFDSGIEYLNKIEIEFLRADVLCEFILSSNQTENFNKIQNLINNFESIEDKYKVLNLLSKKINIESSVVAELVQGFIPDNYLLLEYYSLRHINRVIL